MKLTNLDERIHVLDGETTPSSVMRSICQSGIQEEAFYVCDADDIIFKLKQWKLLLPRVTPHYAVKCNDSTIVLEILAALGTGFDCASKGEINKILDLEVDPNRIIFAHPCKPASHIRHAAALGVNLTTYDNATELHKMKTLHPTCNLVLRMRCDASSSCSQLGIKYGCDPIAEGPDLLTLARDLGLNVVGVSFHVGSGCKEPAAFRRAISLARDLFDMGTELGFNMTLLDIGGGFPGDNNGNFSECADVINTSLDEFFPSPEIQVIAEPGRYFVCSAFTLATNIHSKREIRSPDGNISSVMYYINDGVYGSFNAKLYEDAVFRGVPLETTKAKLLPSSIWGPTCDGIDKVEENVLLPVMELGSWIIYPNLGAYSVPVASPFNGFPVPKVHTVSSHAAWMLLRERLPLSPEHFVEGNTPANLCMGLDLGGAAPISEVARLSLASADLSGSRSSLDSKGSHENNDHEMSDMSDLSDISGYAPMMCRRASVVDNSDITSSSSLFIEFIQVGPMD